MKVIMARRYAIYHLKASLKVQGLWAFGLLRLLSTMPCIVFQSETPPKSQEKVAKSVECIREKFLTSFN